MPHLHLRSDNKIKHSLPTSQVHCSLTDYEQIKSDLMDQLLEMRRPLLIHLHCHEQSGLHLERKRGVQFSILTFSSDHTVSPHHVCLLCLHLIVAGVASKAKKILDLMLKYFLTYILSLISMYTA